MKDIIAETCDFETRLHEIHAAALSALDTPDTLHPSAAADLAELDQLRQGERSLFELETRILLHFAGRIKPSRCRLFLNSLHTLRAQAGELDRFLNFEAMLKRKLGWEFLVGHDYNPDTFGTGDTAPIWADVEAAIEVIRGVTPIVFLNAGTLLGVIRDGALLPHDDDVDLAVVLPAQSHLDAAARWLDFCARMHATGIVDAEQTRASAILKIRNAAGISLDVFPGYSIDGKVHVFPHTFGQLSDADITPLGRCPVSGLPIPARPEKMLQVNYGADWKTPNPYYQFPWKPAKRRFAQFLTAIEGAPGAG